MKNMSIGEEWVWDFGFRYNLIMLELPELEVLMIKYEVELKRTRTLNKDRYNAINEILGRIYKEIMKRRRVILIESVINSKP
ncbi:MAG TPA: hypothetical protein PKN44_16095 [Bacteroidales bacterium]|nr:hypothetical protein [Bacteroidales bacterium]